MNNQTKEKFFQKCVVLLRNGAVFFSTVLIMRGILSGAERFMERFGGYEPLYFLFLAGALILAAAFLFAGEILRPRTDADPASEVAGPLLLLLFVLLPLDGAPAVTILSVLTAGAALTRLPRFLPKCPRAVIMIGCAASGLPAAMFEFLEPVFILAAALLLLVLFPKKWRLPAVGLIVVMLAARMFLPVSLVGPIPGDENKKDPVPPPETLRALYNLTLLACTETASVPQEYQCVTENGDSIRSPARLALAILAENTGGQDPRQYVESDVLRRETLAAAASARTEDGSSGDTAPAPSAGNAPVGQKIQSTEPRIFLFDPGDPANFRQNYRCTESFFQRVKKTLPGDAVIGFLLPEKPGTLSASTLAAVRNTFPHTALFLFPRPMVLASSERALSSDPEELDRRALQGKVYEKLFSPYHILNLALPHFQEPVAVSSLLDAASRAKPNRTDRLMPFHDPASKTEKYFSALTGISLPLTGAVFALYFLLRYFTGWKRERKSVYRSLEAGFLFAGSAFFLAAPFLRFAEPDPSRWFTVCISVAALGTAWAFNYTKGPLSIKLIPRVVLPLLALAGILYFEPHEVWGLFFAAMLTGPAWKNAFVSAAIPLAEEKNERTVFPLSAVMLGAALAVLLLPPLFFVPDGMLAAACLLAVILATRRPALLPA